MEITGPFKETKTKRGIPGPGQYICKSAMEEMGKITMRGKLRDRSTDHLKKVHIFLFRTQAPEPITGSKWVKRTIT